jgi:quercetin dioxygenase-like cupin family protein
VADQAFIPDLAGRLAVVEDGPGQQGLRAALAVDRQIGSSQLALSLLELAGSGSIGPHLHPHEESVYVLRGSVELWIGGAWRRLETSSFALIPTGEAHAWRNAGSGAAQWLSIRSPSVALPMSPALRQIDLTGHRLEGPVVPADIVRPWLPSVGRLEEADVPAPGPLSLGGLGHYGRQVRDVSIAMLLDAQRGAVHHTLFHVGVRGSEVQLDELSGHIHPFEEAFILLEGTTEWQLDGRRYEAGPGDVLWAGSGVQHAVLARGGPACWIEIQSPQPPQRHGFLFPKEWVERSEEPDADVLGPGMAW